ncbi:MAG: nucleotidyltransferase family protein [Egibacteraceae bacterium]
MSENSHGGRRLADLGRRLGPRGLLLLGCREDVLAVIVRHRVSRIRVFGSVARGEDTEASDIDLLVDIDRPTLIDLIALNQDLGELLGRVDVSTPAVLKPHVRERALAEAVVL